MARLNDTTKLVIPQAILGVDGKGVQVVTHPTTGAEYLCAMFTFVEGISPENLSRRAFIRQFERLGEITAILHNDVTAWPESSQAVRFTWDFDELIGPKARLGTWLDSPKLNVLDRVVLENTVEVIHDRLAAYGKGPDRFGLIHSDLRCANLLINRDQTCVIDFDDCGFSWFMYDFGAAVSFIEDHPDMRKLLRSWVKGYRRIRPLGDADVMELKTFVLLRRIFLHGWVTSHWDAADVQNGVGIRHDRVTVDLASKYLDAVAKDKVIW
jgi:Ser/Thr protein kinase RdoA (MazF antagonist)